MIGSGRKENGLFLEMQLEYLLSLVEYILCLLHGGKVAVVCRFRLQMGFHSYLIVYTALP